MTLDDMDLAELIADTCDQPELQAVVWVFVGDLRVFEITSSDPHRNVWLRTPEGAKGRQARPVKIEFPYHKIPTIRALLPARWNGGAGARFEFRVRPNPG